MRCNYDSASSAPIFANGAATSAFGYLYNYCAHDGHCTTKLEQRLYDWWPGYKVGTCISNGDCSGSEFSWAAIGTAVDVAGGAEFKAAKGATKIEDAAKAVEEFLGGQGKIIRNADGDAILMNGDKKIRFDINDPHGDKPHFHLENQTPSGRWKDAGSAHRYYFKDE